MRAVVTGGAGYIGSMVVGRLLAAGHDVAVLDLIQHGQRAVAADLERRGARIVQGDVRDAEARATVLEGADALVHLAAIVGDPACAQDPELSQAVNVDASRTLFAERRRRAADRVRLDVLELRPHGRPHRRARRDRPARARLAVREPEGGDRARAAGGRDARPACASPPSTASARACASTSPSTSSRATCGRAACSRSTAASSGAPTSTSATRRGRSSSCSACPTSRSAGACSTSATRARTSASRTSSR